MAITSSASVFTVKRKECTLCGFLHLKRAHKFKVCNFLFDHVKQILSVAELYVILPFVIFYFFSFHELKYFFYYFLLIIIIYAFSELLGPMPFF